MYNKVLKVISSDKIELSELDMAYPYYGDGVNYDPDGEDRNEVLDDFDTVPAEIEKVLEILNKFKSQGHTHVYMDYHEDHLGYEFVGANFLDITGTGECEERKVKAVDAEKERVLKHIAFLKSTYGV